MDKVIQELKELEVGKVLENEPLSNHTTIKIGGPADVLVVPKNIQAVKDTMKVIKKHGVKWTAIGRGSNLLVLDEGIRGVVIKLGQGLDHMEIDGEQVTVGGGYSVVRLATGISKKGLSGLEFAAGIPGSVGGAVYMNAGAHGSDISKVLVKALILFEDGTIDWLTNEEMTFSYRTSILQNERPGICLEAVLQLEQKERDEIVAQMQKNKDYRKETQPVSNPCAGSIFRNPLPEHAGRLVEEAGLKGYQIGGAKVSEMHGNFIVNAGGATAKDVLDLIAFIQKTIKEKYDIDMHTEVEIIGEKR
ncbi:MULTISPECIES: UDP-N-acetylmuramate dehydrogenase [Bacillus]|uniref:UDP-N-acetylmuramate dehydrogenase n=1 Tax=Bacillus TaxID=1386 RepID=UPI001FB96B41|nr:MULTISPECIES: UDP-N-acetylmuramate dehydrogenase [Bacillus]MCJ2145519.1 UDP-N-acetylmuramate dehydrogenase [Bacillus sp. B19-2]MDN5387094.1 UDP-N-acetylmuramate dehydrogenase [Bacillus sp. LB7]MEC1021763.1 UDP-N-acetylmuramate dehydrogenase [Bacillus paralicheniformis]MEC1025416.1 UDP-N-acetylmuramate dehydrogenase [Bacillus paralicheniformis]MEC1035876.1 UDP-N-acetylmuramate dehydrogenase [Bacillus paralicheniformis]